MIDSGSLLRAANKMGMTQPAITKAVQELEAFLDARASHLIARAGVGLVPEGRHIFPTLTVRENLIATAHNRQRSTEPWTLARIYKFFPRLLERERNLGANLSGGEQQMLAIGRALMTNPRLLILDEATEGLAPLIREEIWRCLAELKKTGLAIICIDKNLSAQLALADRHYLLAKGRVAWSGSSTELRAQADTLRSELSI